MWRGRPEQTLIDRARVDLSGKRHSRAAPGDMRAVNARIADGEIDTGGLRRDAEFERGQGRLVADLLRGDLVHRHAVAVQVFAQGLTDTGRCENRGFFDVMAIAVFGGLIPAVSYTHLRAH